MKWGVFAMLAIREMPKEGIYVFPTQAAAEQWMIEQLEVAGIIEHDGDLWILDGVGFSRAEILEVFQSTLPDISYFHDYPICNDTFPPSVADTDARKDED